MKTRWEGKNGWNAWIEEQSRLVLSCRVQQIQLLGRDMKGPAHDKLWNQLEAEIHLHRHKTVIRACRGRNDPKKPLPSPLGHVSVQLQRRWNSWYPFYLCFQGCAHVITAPRPAEENPGSGPHQEGGASQRWPWGAGNLHYSKKFSSFKWLWQPHEVTSRMYFIQGVKQQGINDASYLNVVLHYKVSWE